jgi:hypothetical protein
MAADDKDDKGRIDIKALSLATAKQYAELRQSVRDAGHSEPSPRTLISALIDAEKRRGKQLEDGLLVPFRKANPDAD